MNPALFVLTCFLALAHTPSLASPAPPTAPLRFVFGLSPFLDATAKDLVFKHLVRFVLEDAPPGSSVHAFDAYQLQTITEIHIPRLDAFASPKTRATQFRQPIHDLRRFLATASPHPESRGLHFDNAVRAPQFLEFVRRHLASPDRTLVVSILGSPLYLDDKEPGFSMAHGFFPSDGHLTASRDVSVFGLQGRDHALDQVLVHWAYVGDPWASDLHREKVSRFWTLYVQGQGGRLETFTGDLPIAFAALREPPPPADATSPPPITIAVTPLDPAHSKVEMLRVTRDVGTTDWIAQESLRHPALQPPSHTRGPMKIGIRWKGDLDLDLYASPGPHQERLSFEHPKTPEGYYFKDHRSSPDREYEFIEFLQPVDLHQVRASINFYEGEIPGGPVGEVRVEFEGRIYSAPFAIEATQGNQGREGDRHSRFWTPLDLPALLKVR